MKLFLCFWVGDHGDRESYSVYYSELVQANNKEDALDKYLKSGKAFAYDEDTNKDYYGVIEMKPII